ncbi:MAG TPA: cation-transporting P-type ATPase, partial [Candidatus Saccharimonadales bacterium]|nr:cation-transporting P-type ATPase [Candidatus Saccharimonadales bacterium]
MDNYKRLNYYRLPVTEVLEEVRSRETGLKPAEARDRLEHMGANALHRASHESAFTTFLRQFKNMLVAILLLSAGISLYLRDGRTAAILFAIALINTLVGFFQEHNAETLFASLQQLMVPKAKVLRA